MSDKIYVITTAYADRSAFEVLCALHDKAKADWLVEFLKKVEPSKSTVVLHEVTTLSNLFGNDVPAVEDRYRIALETIAKAKKRADRLCFAPKNPGSMTGDWLETHDYAQHVLNGGALS